MGFPQRRLASDPTHDSWIDHARELIQYRPMKATRDDKTFTLTGRYWSASYPIEELGKQLEFYRRQREKFPKSGTSYDATIEALERLAKEIKA